MFKTSLVGGKINYYGFLYGAGRGLVFALYAAIFWFTAYLLQIGRLSGDTVMADMMKVLFGIMFAALTAGDASSMAPDYGEALTAAKRIFALLDREVWQSLSEDCTHISSSEFD